MAGKKKKVEKDPDALPPREFRFMDGPRKGTTLRLKNPPPATLRLAFPVWCNYEYDPAEQAYFYIGDQPLSQGDWSLGRQ